VQMDLVLGILKKEVLGLHFLPPVKVGLWFGSTKSRGHPGTLPLPPGRCSSPPVQMVGTFSP
jgi:hypothetical protein